jgi:hypothetical protein
MTKRNLKMYLIPKWKKCQKSNNLSLCFLVFFFTLNLSSQKLVKVNSIKGMAYISGDVSPNQAKFLALNDAKINALKAAGVGENIKSYQLLFNSQEKNEYSQFFSSDIQSEIQGAVTSFDITNQATVKKSEIEMYIEITIDASVIKYETKPDNTFDAYIEGLKAVYNNHDKLTFTVKTTQACYLTIFNITDMDATLMYPNSYEKQKSFDSIKVYNFPSGQVDYALETDLKEKESNRLIFVFTKTAVPFIKMDKDQVTTNDAIFNWIYSIMPDQRKVEYRSLVIQK